MNELARKSLSSELSEHFNQVAFEPTTYVLLDRIADAEPLSKSPVT